MIKQPKNLNPLAAFCQSRKISLRQLSDICGNQPNTSKSQMARLLKDEIEDKAMVSELRQILANNLPNFLLENGLSVSEIDHELLQIFDKGEYQPMINQRHELPLDVAKHFNLIDVVDGKATDPFSKPPRNRSEVFISQPIKAIVDRVIDSIRYQGFTFVSGEIGSGKTTVRSILQDTIKDDPGLRLVCPETYDMDKVSPGSIARAILEDFDAPKVPVDSVSRARMVKKLLAAQTTSGVNVGLDIDEVHRLNDVSVSSLKNLLEMNSGGFQRYLGIVLFGQPQFETRLTSFDEKGRDFREIYERLTILKMPDFSESAFDYLDHRLQLVGADVHELFDGDALELIIKQSKTPLQLGNIANQALILSAKTFKTKTVVGAAIKTKMFFTAKK